jgi:predicted phage terminase large subunit-like protein
VPLTPDDLEVRPDLICDFGYFVQVLFKQQYGRSFLLKPYHHKLFSTLEKVASGEITRLIINIPPRYAKTEIAVKLFIAWCLANNQSAKFIHLSYSDDLALDNSSAIRDIVKSDFYQRFFPVKIRSDSDSKKKWFLEAGGGLYATAAGGAITGFGAGSMGRKRLGTTSAADGFGGCFPYDELVNTESGMMKIGDIVTKRISVKVYSTNIVTGAIELKPIKIFWTNPDNKIIEVGLSDGAVFRCTPDHKIMTTIGWVEAQNLTGDHIIPVGFPNILETGDTNAQPFAYLNSGNGSVLSRLNKLVSKSGLVIPDWIRQVFSDGCPCFSEFDLPNNGLTYPIPFGKSNCFFRTSKNLNDLLPIQFSSGSVFKQWKCAVPDGVLHIIGFSSVSEIFEPVVSTYSVQMPDLFAFDLRPDKGSNDELVDELRLDSTLAGQGDAKPFIRAYAWLEDSFGDVVLDAVAICDGSCVTLDPSYIAYRIKPFIVFDRKPVFINDVGHADVTFCLGVEDNSNFYVTTYNVLVSNCILIDDPVKPDDAFSETMRERVNRRFNNTIASRTNSPETPIVVVMQRLHENDMSGYLLAGGSGEEWEHLCLPAIDEHGEALWPEKHSIEKLRSMEQADPYTFAGQYMQIPSPLAGGIMKPDNITIIPALPVGIVEFVRGWDFAASTKGDFTAGAKIGVLPDGRWLIADMVRIRVSPDERDAALVNTANRDGDNCRISIPQDPGQAGLTQVKYLVRSLSGFSVKATPESGNKVVRAEPFAAQVNVGNVVMLKADWNDALISEMRMFPNGTFDDQVDALSRAFSMLITNEPSQIFIPDVGKPINPLQARILKEMPGLPSAVVDAIQIPSGMFCGNCSAYVSGQCADRGFLVGERDTGCDSFINK